MKLGETIFDFSLPNLEGQPVSIRNYRGKKVLIFLWASWCGCREQLPGWQNFYERFKNKGFEILSIAIDLQGADVVRQYTSNTSFTTVIDSENILGFKFIPSGIFIDEQGVIQFIKEGFRVTNVNDVEIIEKLIDGSVTQIALQDSYHSDNSQSLEEKLAITKFKLAKEYLRKGKKDDALKEIDEALLFDPDNWVIRKQRWYIRFPEKFYPTIDYEWQDRQFQQERDEEVAQLGPSCGPEGCTIPTK